MNYYVDTCIWLNIFNSDEANTKQSKCSKNLIENFIFKTQNIIFRIHIKRTRI